MLRCPHGLAQGFSHSWFFLCLVRWVLEKAVLVLFKTLKAVLCICVAFLFPQQSIHWVIWEGSLASLIASALQWEKLSPGGNVTCSRLHTVSISWLLHLSCAASTSSNIPATSWSPSVIEAVAWSKVHLQRWCSGYDEYHTEWRSGPETTAIVLFSPPHRIFRRKAHSLSLCILQVPDSSGRI